MLLTSGCDIVEESSTAAGIQELPASTRGQFDLRYSAFQMSASMKPHHCQIQKMLADKNKSQNVCADILFFNCFKCLLDIRICLCVSNILTWLTDRGKCKKGRVKVKARTGFVRV